MTAGSTTGAGSCESREPRILVSHSVMLIATGVVTAFAGVSLFLWYRTVVGLPGALQPSFVHAALFKRGFPLLGLLLFIVGIFFLAQVRFWLAAAIAGAASLLSFLTIKFDRYTGQLRIIYDRYLQIRRANPDMAEPEVLFVTARLQYPEWSDDRILELIAQKNVESLLVLMLVRDNKINPISDWELYRSVKMKAARFIQSETNIERQQKKQ